MQMPAKKNCTAESPAADILVEMDEAYTALKQYIATLGHLLDAPCVDRRQLTTVRLQLASIRLVHGAAVARAYRYLLQRLSGAEHSAIQELQVTHQRLLHLAAAHTAQWTLDAVEANWSDYKKTTRALLHSWSEKTEFERQRLYPLLQRYA